MADVIVANKTDEPIPVNILSGLIPKGYDYIILTYVAAGNGAGEIETVTYKSGGASGTTIGILTLAYNGDDKLESITKS